MYTFEKPMAWSRRLAVKQNAPSACAKRRAQRPHLLSQRILGMLPRTTKALSKKHLRTTQKYSKKAPQRPSDSKEACQYLPKRNKQFFAYWNPSQIGQRDPKRPPRKAPRTPPAAPRRFQGASKRCLGSEDGQTVIFGRCTVRNHCFERARDTLEHPKNKPPWVALPGPVARWHPPFRKRVFMDLWRWCEDAILDCKRFFCALLAATTQGARLLEPRGRSKPSTGPPVQAETWLSSRYRCCWYCRRCSVFGDRACCCVPLLPFGHPLVFSCAVLPSYDFLLPVPLFYVSRPSVSQPRSRASAWCLVAISC